MTAHEIAAADAIIFVAAFVLPALIVTASAWLWERRARRPDRGAKYTMTDRQIVFSAPVVRALRNIDSEKE